MASEKASEKAPEKAASQSQLKITQVRGKVGARWKQRESLRTLGLRRIRHSVIREDNAQTRGLIAAVRHLVEVEPADSATEGSAK
ncbi:50S ribosomal protein L30 [Candidatus Mycobacterium methanotrophicum]|uniref:Large ribosomal subunit protein uL30 n=1 Tax=Candidatus Mycobacterium methanotrophicum TaxID=2943498 RepID=A0ABY4QNU3_9MYCO|nr:50S ribosomal protein L30 [Candidatus Mycobacterium methanotrophicum]UQX11626.1 50S ribosomal protein L30 [Candidatus Mycobacterium methanotrophicum]